MVNIKKIKTEFEELTRDIKYFSEEEICDNCVMFLPENLKYTYGYLDHENFDNKPKMPISSDNQKYFELLISLKDEYSDIADREPLTKREMSYLAKKLKCKYLLDGYRQILDLQNNLPRYVMIYSGIGISGNIFYLYKSFFALCGYILTHNITYHNETNPEFDKNILQFEPYQIIKKEIDNNLKGKSLISKIYSNDKYSESEDDKSVSNKRFFFGYESFYAPYVVVGDSKEEINLIYDNINKDNLDRKIRIKKGEPLTWESGKTHQYWRGLIFE